MLFADLRLSEPILRALVSEGYTVPTPIQAKAIPPVLAGRDVLGCAQTGTGKTAAFALPILQRLGGGGISYERGAMSEGKLGNEANLGQMSDERRATSEGKSRNEANLHSKKSRNEANRRDEKFGNEANSSRTPRCLVLCPTRELATQINDSFRTYGQNLKMRQFVVFGGVNQNPQVKALQRGVDILIATPGRLLDLMNQGHVDLSRVEVLVLDEADRMLDMGFIHDIRKVVVKVPKNRQTLLFSATMPVEIRRLADTLLRDPVDVQVAPTATTIETVEQSVYHVEKRNKPLLLAHLVNNAPMTRAIVFTRTKHGADKVVRHLHAHSIKAEAIHGNKSQNARERALNRFRDGRMPVLVATDIASRGIDIDDVTHVVNYDVTHEPETYVHRIGRTGRAGAGGAAVSLVDREEMSNMRAIEKLIRRTIEVKTDHPFYPAREANTEEGRAYEPRPHQVAAARPAIHQAKTAHQPKPARHQPNPAHQPKMGGRQPNPEHHQPKAARPVATGRGAGHRGQAGMAHVEAQQAPRGGKPSQPKPGAHQKKGKRPGRRRAW